MKRCLNIIGFVLVLLFFPHCGREKTQQIEGQGSETYAALAEIDSLMWRQPDSAFVLLQEFVVGPEAEKLDTFDGHYCQVLISELLYKNDFEQTNRTELLQAVAYFDSLVRQAPPLKGGGGIVPPYKWVPRRAGDSKHNPNPNDNLAFLAARAHYINGVGYYENDSVVEACAEYLKTLEVMESHFEEKDLVGHKARFMAYTYNRLGDMFSEQFMMEPAIDCYQDALVFCKIEPTSPQGISNILYRLGKQYDKMGEKTKASDYYEQAIHGLPNNNSLLFRDLVSTKALCDYQLGYGFEQSLYTLKHILTQADNESEYLFRFLTIGGIFFEEIIYDSALIYLEPVFENGEAFGLQSETVNYLHIIYDSLGEKEKADACVRFLAKNKKLDWENKTLVSKLEDLFKNYQNHKQKKQANEERKKSIQKTIGIIVPIAILVALVIYIQIKLRGKKLLKQQQAEAEKALEEKNLQHKEELRLRQIETEQQLEKTVRKHKQKMEEISKRHEEELRVQKDWSEKEIEKNKKRHEEELDAERVAYQKDQEVLHKVLREREEQVDALEKVLNQQREEAELRREAFLKETICCKINDSVRSLYITARDGSRKNVTLTKEDSDALKDAVLRHYENFESFLLSKNPKLKKDDIQLCQLYLLGLDERQIAVLQCKTYSAIKKRAAVLKESMCIKENLSAYILKFSTFGEAS